VTDDELKRLLDASTAANAAENRRHFDETVDRLTAETRHFFELTTEGLRHEIQLVAEGVLLTKEELARTTIEHSDKQTRVERLEGSTH
jgi:hypothetical protein